MQAIKIDVGVDKVDIVKKAIDNLWELNLKRRTLELVVKLENKDIVIIGDVANITIWFLRQKDLIMLGMEIQKTCPDFSI